LGCGFSFLLFVNQLLFFIQHLLFRSLFFSRPIDTSLLTLYYEQAAINSERLF